LNGCPLCGGGSVHPFHRYLSCDECGFVSLPEDLHPSRQEERARYELHENSLEDERYLHWLSETVNAVTPYLRPGDAGLDYCAGPVAAMGKLFAGFRVAAYDPFFFPDEGVFREKFDFVVAHEVVEHFRKPEVEWEKMAALARPGGILAVRTEMLTDEVDFSRWHYRRDITHLGFYRRATMQWLAHRHGWQILYQVGAVTVFRRS